MNYFFDTTNLHKVDTQKDADIYQLQSDDFINRYYIVSSEGTRHLMASPEVVGFDSYLSMIPSTIAALNYLIREGFSGSVNILTILRGGLNYPLEECCHQVGLQVDNINFVSCERVIDSGAVTGLDIKYEKLYINRDCTLIIGDIIASGDTLRLCLQQVVDSFCREGGSIRRIIFFTIGGSRAISLLESFTASIRMIWPEFEGFQCFFYEGVFNVYEDKGVTGVNIPGIDFCWKGGIISPEFRSYILNDSNALFEKCIIYDGGARRYEIPTHYAEVMEYWDALEEAAEKSDFRAFLSEKIGYEGMPDFERWLDITRYRGLSGMEILYHKEQRFLEEAMKRNLIDICRERIKEFKERMSRYNQ